MWFFERGVVNKRHDYFRDGYLEGIWDAFWWAFIVMTMGGFENEVPHKKISRLFAMIWIVASLFFISTLTAKITTALTVSELSNGIESVNDLIGKKIGIMAGPTTRDYLQQYNITPMEYDEKSEIYQDLKQGKIEAIVGDAPILQYYAIYEKSGKVKLAGGLFKPENYGAIFPEGSALKETFDQNLIEMQEDGTYKQIYEKYFGQ